MASTPNIDQPIEAADPQVDFGAFVDRMTATLEASTSAAAQLPDKSDMSFHRTLDRKFAKGMDVASARVLKLTNQLLEFALQPPSAESNADTQKKINRSKIEDEDVIVDHFRSSVIDIVDSLLEHADSNLDDANGQKRKAAIEIKASLVAQAGKKLPGPLGIATSGYLPSHLLNDDSITKPQLNFEDEVNNSYDQPEWAPTLPLKHHAMVPLTWQASEEDMPTYGSDSEVTADKRESARRMRHHPYFYETKHLPYPTSLFTSAPPISPRSFEDTPFEFVDTPEQLVALTEELKRAKEIAIDLEANNVRSYYGITCLMQISTRERDWVVDVLALRSEIRRDKLGGVLADPATVKVLHGADSDIIWMQRDFDLYVVNLFDTYQACKVLDFPQFSLASLLKLYCDYDTDKRYQRADWRIRPLPADMLHYARCDTHFLLFIYDNLRNALISRASRTPSPVAEVEGGEGASTPKPNPQRAVRQVLDKSSETALQLYSKQSYNHETGVGYNGYASLLKKLGRNVDAEVTFVFKRLHFWRDALARELDESPHHLLSNSLLLNLARLRPKNPVVLARRVPITHAPLVQPHINELSAAIVEALDDYQKTVTRRRSPSPKCSPSPIRARSPKRALSLKHSTSPKRSPSPTRSRPTPKPAAEPPRERAKFGAEASALWADLINGHKKKAAVSSLFGDMSKHKAPTATAAASSTRSSSLFGSTLTTRSVKTSRSNMARSAREASPAFLSVQSAIHSDLRQQAFPNATTNPVESTSADAQPVSSAIAEPETVEFVPAVKRKNAGSIHQSNKQPTVADAMPTGAVPQGSTANPSTTPATVNAEGIVTVKKNRKAKKAVAAEAAGSAPPADANSDKPAPAQKRKAKVKAEDIPHFDYTTVPDLLDDVDAATYKSKKRKVKDQKKKKPSDNIDTSAFRKPPSDPTQPKSGNRSGTFAH